MPSHQERVIIEYFGENIYHIYWQNKEMEILGTNGENISAKISHWIIENLRKEGRGVMMADSFHVWWDNAGYTAKNEEEYEEMKKAFWAGWNAHILALVLKDKV